MDPEKATEEEGTTETPQGKETPPLEIPTAEERLAHEREQRLRLEGENRVLRESARPKEEPKADFLTVEQIEDAYAANQITDAQRIDLRADLRVRQQFQARDAETERARPVVKAQERLAGYLTQYPALKDANSDLIDKVTVELQDLAELGHDPKDPRTQLIAVERVVGGHRLGGGGTIVDHKEFNRRRIPTGGGAGGSGTGTGKDGGGGKEDPLKHVPKAQIDYWKGRGYTQAEMEAEAPFVKARPHRGFV